MASAKSKYKKHLYWFWGIFSFPFVFITLLFTLISFDVFGPMPSFEQLENPENDLASEVWSEDGELLGKYYIKNRTWTNIDKISPYIIDALIATEDIRFHKHSGIDIRGLGRVVYKTLLQGESSAGGGSTITQQLAKNLFPRDTTTYKLALVRMFNLGITKFKEWVTAVKLEKSYTKNEIITMYLNVFDFLYQAVGIHSAASIYFNTTPDSLKIEEAAMLVGMVKNPAYYNPLRRYDKIFHRRNIVLSQMVKYGYMKKELYDSVKTLPIELDFTKQSHNLGLATYFREYLRIIMSRSKPERRYFFTEEQYEEAKYQWENNPLYGWCSKNTKPDGAKYNLYRDGLKIFSTVNSTMQKYAEEAVKEHLGQDLQETFMASAENYQNPPFSDDLNSQEISYLMEISIHRTERYRKLKNAGVSEDSINASFNKPVEMRVFSWDGEIDTVMTPLDSIRYYKYYIRAGLMSIDPQTGYVKAYVGGPDFKYFKYDAVTNQKRQIGSIIKPFLYTLAMQDGYSPCYQVPNVPQTFIVNDSVWRPRSTGPRNYWGKMVSLKWGLAHSENYISAWLIKRFNPQSVRDVMQKMGIRSFIDPVPSIFLGTSEISLYEMVGGYGTFANKGVHISPIFVTRIEDKDGNLISIFKPSFKEAISEANAYLMLNLLQGVIKEGTGSRLRWKYELMNEIGGKTGTTQNQSDGWFIGVTPKLVTGIWAGWPDRSVHFERLALGAGANMALPVFGLYMQKIYNDSLSVTIEDVFDPPRVFNIELDCDQYKKAHPQNDYDPFDDRIY